MSLPPRFHRLSIREVRNETADAICVAFDVPDDLRDAYRFRQGQYLTLRCEVGGEQLRRAYSVCSGVPEYDTRGELRVAIKRVAGGRFSNWANQTLRAGQSIDVMTPDGRFFTELDSSRRRRYLGLAGGSGITPMLSLLKTTLAIEPASEFTLIYGNRSVGSIMFVEELAELKNRFMTRLRLFHVLSDEPQDIELLNGLLDDRKCAELLSVLLPEGSLDEAFVCGPEPMMQAAERALLDSGMTREHIHVERFGAAPAATSANAAGTAAPAPPASIAPDAARAHVVMVLDGKQRTVRAPYEGPSILDVGLTAGLNLPFACKAGVCCTCRARVLEGEVTMERNFSLDAGELERGFVLSCQCRPVSARVVLSYDER